MFGVDSPNVRLKLLNLDSKSVKIYLQLYFCTRLDKFVSYGASIRKLKLLGLVDTVEYQGKVYIYPIEEVERLKRISRKRDQFRNLTLIQRKQSQKQNKTELNIPPDILEIIEFWNSQSPLVRKIQLGNTKTLRRVISYLRSKLKSHTVEDIKSYISTYVQFVEYLSPKSQKSQIYKIGLLDFFYMPKDFKTRYSNNLPDPLKKSSWFMLSKKGLDYLLTNCLSRFDRYLLNQRQQDIPIDLYINYTKAVTCFYWFYFKRFSSDITIRVKAETLFFDSEKTFLRIYKEDIVKDLTQADFKAIKQITDKIIEIIYENNKDLLSNYEKVVRAFFEICLDYSDVTKNKVFYLWAASTQSEVLRELTQGKFSQETTTATKQMDVDIRKLKVSNVKLPTLGGLNG